MIQPISGTPVRPPGEGQNAPSAAGEQPLSTQQRTVLERLIARLISLTQQQSAEVWAGMKHDLGVKSDTPLQSRHFPAAEQNLNQRLGAAQQNHVNRQVLSQLTELLSQGNNRQAVSDFIRQQYGQTTLSQLTPEQLKNMLTLLQQGQLSIPQPQQRPVTDRPLLPAEHNTLNQLVTKLAAATGESGKMVWQSVLGLSGVKSGELIPAKQFTHLVTWLQARQTLDLQSAPTLQTLQAALKLSLGPNELTAIKEYAQQTYQIRPQSTLTTVQVQDLLNQAFLRCVERERELSEPRHLRPIHSPFAPMIEMVRSLSARSGLLFVASIIALIILWLVT